MAVPTNIRVRVRERARALETRGETHGKKKKTREVCLARRAYVHENCDRGSVTFVAACVRACVCTHACVISARQPSRIATRGSTPQPRTHGAVPYTNWVTLPNAGVGGMTLPLEYREKIAKFWEKERENKTRKRGRKAASRAGRIVINGSKIR